MTRYSTLVKLLTEARNHMADEYMYAGGDQEARTNPSLRHLRSLIGRIERALAGATRPRTS